MNKCRIQNIKNIIANIICVLLMVLPEGGFSFNNALLMRKPAFRIEVPIELVDTGIDSDVAAYTFEMTRTTLDTNDYDGEVKYFFEVIAASVDSVPRSISLLDPSNNAVTSISVPANAPLGRFRVNFTPVSGASNYRIRMPAVTAISNVYMRSARIIIQQKNPTTTKIYYPLTSDRNDYSTSVDLQFDGSTGPYWYIGNALSIRWLKDVTNLATIAAGNAWTLETVIASTSATGTAQMGLAQENTSTIVTGSTATTTNTTPTLVTASFANNATNFTDNINYQVKVYNSEETATTQIYKAGIWVKLTNLTKGYVMYRVGRARPETSSTTPIYRPQARMLISTGVFSNPKFFYETTSRCSAASCATTSLYDNGTNDSGTTSPTLVAGSTITYAGTAYGRIRSPELTLTSNNRFYTGYTRSAGTYNFVNGAIVVNFSK